MSVESPAPRLIVSDADGTRWMLLLDAEGRGLHHPPVPRSRLGPLRDRIEDRGHRVFLAARASTRLKPRVPPQNDRPFLTAINRWSAGSPIMPRIGLNAGGYMRAGQTWVIVAEAGRARIFALQGLQSPLKELEDLVNPEARAPEHDLASDRPGRTTDSVGSQRHAKQPHTSPGERVVQNFARTVADHIERARTHGEFENLIVAAAPEFLGLLRRSLSEATRQKIKREIHKNIVREDESNIRGYLQS